MIHARYSVLIHVIRFYQFSNQLVELMNEKMNGYIMGLIHHLIKKKSMKLLKLGKSATYKLNL